jgi:hypothetical protein
MDKKRAFHISLQLLFENIFRRDKYLEPGTIEISAETREAVHVKCAILLFDFN